jgi:hypothetical protein
MFVHLINCVKQDRFIKKFKHFHRPAKIHHLEIGIHCLIEIEYREGHFTQMAFNQVGQLANLDEVLHEIFWLSK